MTDHHHTRESPMTTTHVTDASMRAKIAQVRNAAVRRWDTDRLSARLLLAVADAATTAHAAQVDTQAAVDDDPADASTYDELAGVNDELMRWTPVFAAALASVNLDGGPVHYCPRCLTTHRAQPRPTTITGPVCDHVWHRPEGDPAHA